MEKGAKPVTIWTNDVDDEAAKEAIRCLNEGIPVRIDTSCTGHVRAAIVEAKARTFFKEVGAKEVELPLGKTEFTETYYMMG